MSSLGFGVSLCLALAAGVYWLAWDARVERSKLVRQIPLPLDYTDSGQRRSRHTKAQQAMILVGFLLILLSAACAVLLGRLATMQPSEAAAVFIAYPLLRSLWGHIMGVGPIVCVIMAVPGTYCIRIGLGSERR